MRPLPETPFVSIVTPSFNTGRFIERTLRSVEEQDYPLVEHIVLDSNSTDETPDILKRFPGVRLISPAPGGICEKMDFGFSIARGDIVAWLNADDFYLPGAITKAVQALKTHPDAALVYCNYLHVDEHGVEIERMRSKQANFNQLLEEQNYVPHQTAFMRKEALDQVGTIDAHFPRARFLDGRYPLVSDWDLWIRISRKFPILHIDDWWGAFRVSKGQMSDVHKYPFWTQGRKMTRGHGARFFSPLFWDYWRGKFSRALLMIRRRQFGSFNAKLRDLIVGFGRR